MKETQVQSLGLEDLLEKEMQPIRYSCLENPMDRGAWWAAVYAGHSMTRSPWRTKESDTTESLI